MTQIETSGQRFSSATASKFTLSAVSTVSVLCCFPELPRATVQPGATQSGWTCYRNSCWPDLNTLSLFQILVSHYISCTFKRVRYDHVTKAPLFIQNNLSSFSFASSRSPTDSLLCSLKQFAVSHRLAVLIACLTLQWNGFPGLKFPSPQ